MSDPQSAALDAMRAGRHEEAESRYRQLLASFPHPAFMNNLGLVLVAQRRDAEAVPLFQQAIASRPADIGARLALSNALLHCDRPAEALACCNEMLLMSPGHRDARHNRAVALRGLARNEEAAAATQALLAEDPDDVDAEFNLALAELMLGRYETAWTHYEARWRGPSAQRPLPDCGVTAWKPGETLQGLAVLMQAEQGFGDTLQFMRLVPALLEVARRVELHVPAAIHGLAQRSFGGAHVAVLGTEPASGTDCRLGLLSLPLALGSGDCGRAEPYLRPDADRIAQWNARLPPGRKVAVAWRGNPTARHDARRAVPLAALAPWLQATALRGLGVVALQRDIDAAERRFLASYPHVAVPGESLADFDDTAACLMMAQHVASADTAVAHLAGALGRPGTVMLHFASDWHWGIDRPPGSTYRSLRTLRQQARGEWQPVVRALIDSLP